MPSQPETSSSTETVKKVKSFKTSRGSIYTYDEEGKTSRFKAVTGEQRPRKDVTVFLPLTEEQEHELLEALENRTVGHEFGIYVVERQPDNSVKTIQDIADVQNSNSVYLAIAKDGQVVKANQVTLQPVVGYNVFDTRYANQAGKIYSYHHLGNRVTEIYYE
jgi:hypothetical protein